MGFRAIARVTDIDHTTIINWVEEAGESEPDESQEDEIPEITEIDELQTNISDVPRAKLWKSQRLLWVIKRINSGFGRGRGCAQCLASRGQMLRIA